MERTSFSVNMSPEASRKITSTKTMTTEVRTGMMVSAALAQMLGPSTVTVCTPLPVPPVTRSISRPASTTASMGARNSCNLAPSSARIVGARSMRSVSGPTTMLPASTTPPTMERARTTAERAGGT